MGIAFEETLAGSLRVVGRPGERPISLTIRGRSGRFATFLRQPEIAIEGEVDAEGLADHRRLRGAIDARSLRERRLPYTFEFTGDDGNAYTFSGEKRLDPGALLESFSLLLGEIRGAHGALVGTALLRFDLRTDAQRYLQSFRILG